MNKEQAIKLFEGLIEDTERAKKSWGTGDTGYYTSEALISAYNLAISVLKVMDVGEQPKQDKPVVKQFVADWFEAHSNDLEFEIYQLSLDVNAGKTNDVHYWFGDDDNHPIETLIKMRLFGYTVEQPKRWVVKNDKGYVAMENFKDFNTCRVGVRLSIVDKKSEGSAWDDEDLKKAEALAVLVDGSVEEV